MVAIVATTVVVSGKNHLRMTFKSKHPLLESGVCEINAHFVLKQISSCPLLIPLFNVACESQVVANKNGRLFCTTKAPPRHFAVNIEVWG